MRRRHAVVMTGLVVLLGVGIALGGAAVSKAGPRLIDPFTVTATPTPTVVNLEAQSTNKLDDVFATAGGSNATDPVTMGNPTSTRLTTPATGAFEPIVVSEGAVDPNTCGSGKSALYATSTVSAPG